ncbi:F-box/kelch-repeat protein At3g27150 isoform X2 [Cryptomeria japonica]|uniref:F-box/kelch-repeat protein At3g27150 isoform X2 n=1 Tax=Cryptomeria japonica TaxID=3369 RepID=UPI0027DA21F2|nr:F-box/kelch-repeat protein At3g27150 isoform X2 [Cryptomeria japonica]
MVEKSGRLFSAMDCQDHDVEQDLAKETSKSSSVQVNGRRYDLRHRNGFKSHGQPNGKLRCTPNGKASGTVSIDSVQECKPLDSTSFGSSRKKHRNRVNVTCENGGHTRKLEIGGDCTTPSCKVNGEAKVVAATSLIEEADHTSPIKELAADSKEDAESGSFNDQSQDADYSYMPGLNDELALLCLAHTSRAEYGTQLLVLGREIEGLVIWRYDLVTNKWYKGPAMLTPRCLYASASCGNFAFVAGGISATGELLNCAERYDPDNQRWEPLPNMNKKRKLCSGCYMDGKFYVIGGTGEHGDLACGEVYDSEKKSWELIENMKPSGSRNPISQAPPLVAVANNELYALEASMNQLKVYIKKANKWRVLGEVPVRADFNSGWGVAFKSLGNELLLIGGDRDASQSMYAYGISIYTSRPDPSASEADWRFLTRVGGSIGPFVFNCAIMAT